MHVSRAKSSEKKKFTTPEAENIKKNKIFRESEEEVEAVEGSVCVGCAAIQPNEEEL